MIGHVIAESFCVIWGLFLVALMLVDVKSGDLTGFLVKGFELAGLIVTTVVLFGALT